MATHQFIGDFVVNHMQIELDFGRKHKASSQQELRYLRLRLESLTYLMWVS